MPVMVLQAISPILPTVDNFDEKNSNHSVITENLTLKKSEQIFHTDNQSSISIPNNFCSFKPEYNNTTFSEGVSTTVAIKILPPTGSTLIKASDIPLQVPTISTRNILDSRNNTYVFERPASRHNSSDTTRNTFQFENTVLLLVWSLKELEKEILFLIHLLNILPNFHKSKLQQTNQMITDSCWKKSCFHIVKASVDSSIPCWYLFNEKL